MRGDPHRSPLLCTLYRQYVDSQDSAALITAVSQSYTQGTLERLSEHESPEVRRAAVLALGFLGDYGANAAMGRALVDEDRAVRMLAENGIRDVWTRAGNDDQRRRLRAVIRLNSTQHYEQAVRRASELIEKAPWYAEAWNQRAIARFALRQYAESIRDSHQALEINPYHFAAAAGMGHAYLRLANPVSALECFRRALRLNPDQEAVRVHVDRLTRQLGGK